jgi:putative transposase
VLERMFREVRRRSRVVAVFPSDEAYIRLLTCYLIEYSEDWFSEKSYISKEAIEKLKSRSGVAA